MFFKRISFKAQLMGFIYTLLALIVLSTLVSLQTVKSLKDEIHEIVEEDIPITKAITDLTLLKLEQAILFEKAFFLR